MPEPTAAALLSADAYALGLGVELMAADPVTVGLTVTAAHLNFRGTGHGAVVHGLADVALSLASNTSGRPGFMIDSHMVATSKASLGDRLVAVAEQVTAGETLGTYRITVTNQDDRVVALFTGSVIRR